MFCSQCGKRIQEGATYCTTCGSRCDGNSAETTCPSTSQPFDKRSTNGASETLPPNQSGLAGGRLRKPTVLRELLCSVWNTYGVTENQTNDVAGVTHHLKNCMRKEERRFLPEQRRVTAMIAAIEACLDLPERNFTRKELEIAAALPDLRAQHTYQIESLHEGSGNYFERDVVGEVLCSCECLRRRAAALSAAADASKPDDV